MRVLQAALAAVLALLPLAAAAPAAAAPVPAQGGRASCADTYFAVAGRELFEVEQRYVPPPLRAFDWDCASKIADREWGDGVKWPVYDLVWTNVDYRTVVDVLRAFERDDWIQGDGAVGAVNDTDGLSLTAAELDAIEPDPYSVRARFGDDTTGEDIVELYYWDGDEVIFHESITTPTLLISLTIRPGGFDRTGLGDPSVLSDLRTVGDVRLTATGGAVLGSSAVILMLVVGYPSALLDSVVSPRLDALRSRLAARRKRPAAGAPPADPRSRPWLFGLGLAASAAVVGFVDPEYGLNEMSLRLFLTAFVSLALFNLATLAAVRAVLRRIDPASSPVIAFRWGSLLFVVLAVLLARLLDFQPGVILGLVAGLTFAATLSATREALVVLLGSGLALGIGLLAWLGYSLLAPVAGGGNAALRFLVELLSGVTIEGISTMPLALLPLLALDGAALFAWRKWVWALAYAVGLAAFLLVMVTVPDSWTAIDGDYARWVVLFTAFGLVALAVWALHVSAERRKSRDAAGAGRPPADAAPAGPVRHVLDAEPQPAAPHPSEPQPAHPGDAAETPAVR